MPRKGDQLVHKDSCCTARTRDGDLCKNPPMIASRTCRMHGSATKASRAKAEERIAAAADPAAAKLVELMSSQKVPHNVQLAAARDLLDRAGIGPKGQPIQVELKPWLANIQGLLVDVPEDVLDAEIVEADDEPLALQSSDDGPVPDPENRPPTYRGAR